MNNVISTFKKLSIPGVLFIHLGDRKLRIVNSSNIVSSIQRILPELSGSEKIEVLFSNIYNKKLRSLMCYIQKKRMETLGYKIIQCSVKTWWLDKKIEDVGDGFKWVLRAKNTYSDMVIGIFEKEEMDTFCKAYYPGGVISAAIISSNIATKRYYEIYPEG